MTDYTKIKDDIIFFSAKLLELDLVEYKGGNISVRVGNQVLISRRASNKAVPSREDIIITSLDEDDENAYSASSALEIHREIYRLTDAQAVIHAHPPLVNTLSFFFDTIEPVDENGILHLGPRMPVVAAPVLFGWNLVATQIAEALVDNWVAVLKWHGTFAKGPDLERALHRTRAAQVACGHIIHVEQLKSLFGEPSLPPREVAEFVGGIEVRGLQRVTISPV